MYSSMNVHRESKHISMFGIPWSTGDSGTWSCFKRQEIEIICSAPTLDAEVTLLQEETKLTYEKYKDRSGDFPYRQTVVLALAQWQRSSAGAAPLDFSLFGSTTGCPAYKTTPAIYSNWQRIRCCRRPRMRIDMEHGTHGHIIGM